MSLNYDFSRLVSREGRDWPKDGTLLVRPDEKGVARFLRRDDGSPLLPGEQLLRYRARKYFLRLGAEAFYFQEGHAADYQGARYGELRVTSGGDAVLVDCAARTWSLSAHRGSRKHQGPVASMRPGLRCSSRRRRA